MKPITLMAFFYFLLNISSCFKEIDENQNIEINKALIIGYVMFSKYNDSIRIIINTYKISNLEDADDSRRDDFVWSWTSVTKDAQSMFGISLLDSDGKVLDKSFGRNGQYLFLNIAFQENKQYNLNLTNATDTYNLAFETKFLIDNTKREIVYKNDTAHDVAYTIESTLDTVYLTHSSNDISGVYVSDGYAPFPSGHDLIRAANTTGDSVVVYYSQLDPTNYRRMKYPIIGSPRYGTDAFETLLERKLNIGLYFINAEVYQKSIQNQEYAKNATNPFVLQPSWKGNIDTGNLIGDFSVIQVE